MAIIPSWDTVYAGVAFPELSTKKLIARDRPHTEREREALVNDLTLEILTQIRGYLNSPETRNAYRLTDEQNGGEHIRPLMRTIHRRVDEVFPR